MWSLLLLLPFTSASYMVGVGRADITGPAAEVSLTTSISHLLHHLLLSLFFLLLLPGGYDGVWQEGAGDQWDPYPVVRPGLPGPPQGDRQEGRVRLLRHRHGRTHGQGQPGPLFEHFFLSCVRINKLWMVFELPRSFMN